MLMLKLILIFGKKYLIEHFIVNINNNQMHTDQKN